MKKTFYWATASILGVMLLQNACSLSKSTTTDVKKTEKMPPPSIGGITYPQTAQESASDNYHGTTIKDPYRWLENDNSDATKNWVKAQNAVTFGYLDKIPSRKKLRDRLTELWNYEKFSTPIKEGSNYYFFKNDGLQNQSVMYAQKDLSSTPTVFLDPNKLSTDGTVALGTIAFNAEGSLAAYQISEAGSDWQIIKVKDVKTGETLKDEVKWVKFSGIAWEGDGFYYSRYPEPDKGEALKGRSTYQKIYFHRVGTEQKEDVLIHENKENPNIGFGANTTTDERFVVLTSWESTSGNGLYIWDRKSPNDRGLVEVVGKIEKDYDLVDNEGDLILIKTNDGAPKSRIIAIDANNVAAKNWKEIIPESEDVLQSAQILGGKLICTYLHNASSAVKVFTLTGKFIADLELPDVGTVGGFSGKRNDQASFYSFSSFTRPTTVYSLDLNTLDSKVFKAPNVKFDVNNYETKQVWYKSADGTKIPMFIVHKKGIELNGKNPTLLYGYGGFNISMLPGFALTRTIFLEQGGVYAVANLRGGGEFGEDWHKAGTKERKQNVFNDFIAAAEYLISEKYTTPQYLAIEGGSNGGLLVGACMTQRPDLYRVCFPRVGVLDMLRYDKFTVGRAWASDYGLSENAEEFKYLIKYSPLHNLKTAAYPSTMVMTADHDDRVVPAHSFKFAATLQAKQAGANPTLIRIETSAGHGAGKPTSKTIEETADMVAFMLSEMGIPVK
ncbi:MAG: hypothetical protein RL757_1267 [Bacteroidota bacterium]|jgi:prolyl oligopeptidase